MLENFIKLSISIRYIKKIAKNLKIDTDNQEIKTKKILYYCKHKRYYFSFPNFLYIYINFYFSANTQK